MKTRVKSGSGGGSNGSDNDKSDKNNLNDNNAWQIWWRSTNRRRRRKRKRRGAVETFVQEINMEMLTFDMDDPACRCWSCCKHGSRSANNRLFASKDKTMLVELTSLPLPLTNSTKLPSKMRWRQRALQLQKRRERYRRQTKASSTSTLPPPLQHLPRYAISARSHQFWS